MFFLLSGNDSKGLFTYQIRYEKIVKGLKERIDDGAFGGSRNFGSAFQRP